jgi:hypothetical protein
MKYILEIENSEDKVFIEELLTRLGFNYEKVEKIENLDETDYLFSTKVNKNRLQKSINNADKGKNLTDFDIKNFKKQFGLE